MSISVLSKTLDELYDELGFGKDKGRDFNTLREPLAALPKDTLIGNLEVREVRPLHKANSPEAQTLAKDFCITKNYGEHFWSNHSRSDWPSWPNDRPRFVDSSANRTL